MKYAAKPANKVNTMNPNNRNGPQGGVKKRGNKKIIIVSKITLTIITFRIVASTDTSRPPPKTKNTANKVQISLVELSAIVEYVKNDIE